MLDNLDYCANNVSCLDADKRHLFKLNAFFIGFLKIKLYLEPQVKRNKGLINNNI